MTTRADVELAILEYEPGEGDPPNRIALLRAQLRAGGVDEEPAPAPDLVTGAEAVDLPSPDPVIRFGAGALNRPAVVSVGEPAILAAPGGAGKSYIALALLAAAAAPRGPARDVFVAESPWREALGFELRRGPMLLISYEDSCGRIGERLGRIGAPRETLDHLHIWDDPPGLFSPASGVGGAEPSGGFSMLEAAIRDVGPSLVVIDPISAMMGACGLNDPTAARAAIRAIARLSTETGAGVLLIAHDTKAARNESRAGGSPGAGAVAGSGQWHDAARCVIYLHRPPDGTGADRELECVKANHGRAGWAQPLREAATAGEAFAGFVADGPAIPDYARAQRARRDAATGKASHEKPHAQDDEDEDAIA